MNYSELTKIEWLLYHKRERTPLLVYFFVHGSLVSPNSVYAPTMKTIASCAGNMIGAKKDWDLFSNNLWVAYRKKPRVMLKYMQQAYAVNTKDQITWRKLLSNKYDKVQPAELLKEYQKYVDAVVKYGVYAFVPFMIEKQLAQSVLGILKKHFRDWEKYENLVMTPLRQTATAEERLSLLNLAIVAKNAGLDSLQFKRQLEKHTELFSFLKSKGMFFDFHSKEYFLHELRSVFTPAKEYKKLLSSYLKSKKDFDKLLEKLSPDERVEVRTLNEAIYFRSWRSEAMDQSSYYVQNLFAAVARVLKLNKAQDVLYLYPEEVKNGLKGLIKDVSLRRLILERRRGFAFFRIGSRGYQIEGQAVNKLLSKLKFSEVDDNIALQGRPAFRGLVRGRAVLVLSKSDYKKIEGTDILVTDSTLPDMVPYMRKIKAIVAEEGSVLSHASVISRELKIPAVIGVVGVTKKIKDGDLIEVDAINGVVKKI